MASDHCSICLKALVPIVLLWSHISQIQTQIQIQWHIVSVWRLFAIVLLLSHLSHRACLAFCSSNNWLSQQDKKNKVFVQRKTDQSQKRDVQRENVFSGWWIWLLAETNIQEIVVFKKSLVGQLNDIEWYFVDWFLWCNIPIEGRGNGRFGGILSDCAADKMFNICLCPPLS